MPVTAIFRVVFVALLTLVACSTPSTDPIEPAWPPSEGAYCGDSPDLCTLDGTPWTCGPRPLWSALDCVEICAALGGSPQGCLLEEDQSRRLRAPAGLLEPARGAVLSQVPGVRCLCDPEPSMECSGLHASTCADRESLWSCNSRYKWEIQRCDDVCADMDPPLSALGCEAAANPGVGSTGSCRCTSVGAPCENEGLRTCSHGTWLLCDGGKLEVEMKCAETLECSSTEVPSCDFSQDQSPACICAPL